MRYRHILSRLQQFELSSQNSSKHISMPVSYMLILKPLLPLLILFTIKDVTQCSIGIVGQKNVVGEKKDESSLKIRFIF